MASAAAEAIFLETQSIPDHSEQTIDCWRV